MSLSGLSKRGFNRLEPLRDFSALILDLRDTEIQLLQFDKGGKILVQRTPMSCCSEQRSRLTSFRGYAGGPTRT